MSAQSRNTTMVAMTASQARVIIWSAPCLGAPVHARTGRSSWPRLMVGALPGDLEVSGAAGAAAGPHAPVAQCRQGAELQQEGDGEVCPAPGMVGHQCGAPRGTSAAELIAYLAAPL